MALREILARFGVEIEGKEKLEKFDGAVTGIVEKCKKLGEVLAGGLIAEGFGEFIHGQIEAGEEMQVMAERLGTTTDELQKFQYAAGQSGASVEEANTAFRFLNRHIGDAATGGAEAAKTFASLGISVRDVDGKTRPALDVLGDLAEKFSQTDDAAKQTALAVKIFGRGGVAMVPILKDGRKGLEDMGAEFEELGGGMSKEFAEQAEETGKALKRLRVSGTGVKSMLAQMFLPLVESAAKALSRWAKVLIDLNRRTNVFRAALILLTAAGIFSGLKRLFSLFEIGEMSAGKMLMTLLKFGLPVLIIGALALLFEDLFTLMTGGDSVIGRFLDQMFGVGSAKKFVADMKGAWDQLTAAITAFGPILGDVASTFGKMFVDCLPALMKFSVVLVNGVLLVVQEIWNAITGTGKALKALFNSDWEAFMFGGPGKEGRDNGTAFDAQVKSMLDEASNIANARENSVSTALAVGTPAPTIVNNISGVSDPAKAAELAGKATKSALADSSTRDAYYSSYEGL